MWLTEYNYISKENHTNSRYILNQIYVFMQEKRQMFIQQILYRIVIASFSTDASQTVMRDMSVASWGFYFFRSIDVFKAPTLKLLCSVQQHHKIINALCWHHEHSAQSDLQYLLASGSSSATVYIHDLRSAIGQNPLYLSSESSLNDLLSSVFISYRNPIREFSTGDWTLQDSVWTHQQNHRSGLEPSSRRAPGDGVLRRHSSGKFYISYSHEWALNTVPVSFSSAWSVGS